MNAFTIKDLENLSGIKAHTIRIWEQRYSFLKPQRTGTNIRYYSNEELAKILNIALLNKYGYKISHISRMTDEEMSDSILALTHHDAVQERIVNDLVACMVDMDVARFEQILTEQINSKGVEKTVGQIIFPFLEKTGLLWQTSRILPAQEHLVSNIIRQKLIAGTDAIETSINLNKTALLFLPEDEYHEIGLLFMQYYFKIRGFKVLYSGASTTLTDLQYMAMRTKPNFIYSHLICLPTGFNFERFLSEVNAAANGIPFIASGAIARQYKKALPPNIYFCHSLADVLECASSI